MGITLDDDLLRDFFGNGEQRSIFDARARLQGWLDTERALAETQAELGLIPIAAAERIAAACEATEFDLDKLRGEINAAQHPIVPVVHALEQKVGAEAARFVHFGATSQDIMDTGQALQLRTSLVALERDIAAAIEAAASLSREHRDTAQAGRTHGQHAVPITFGLKAATWLDELQRFALRVREARPRILAAQIFGAAGTMAAFGPRALEIKAGVARRLDLTDPGVPWHATRDRMAELGALMSLLAGAAERIAAEVIHLQSNEFGELTEPLQPGHIGSSTMPQKRNPALSDGLVAKARLIHGVAAVLLRNGAHQHERDLGAWAVEWMAVPEVMIIAGATAADLRQLLEGIQVHADRMRENLDLTGGQIAAEALMMALDPAIGRDHAHHLLIELTRTADREDQPFAVVAAADSRVTKHLSAEELSHLLDPARYVGLAPEIADAASRGSAATSTDSREGHHIKAR